MIIIQDCREKLGHHNSISLYCDKHQIPMFRMRLDVGDYMLGKVENGRCRPIGTRSIDTKQDIAELASDLYRDKLTFNKKYKKCYDNGIQLYVLVEQEITSLSDIVAWKSKHTKVNGRMLLDMIDRVKKSYGVKFVFCKKEDVAQNIINILSNKN